MWEWGDFVSKFFKPIAWTYPQLSLLPLCSLTFSKWVDARPAPTAPLLTHIHAYLLQSNKISHASNVLHKADFDTV